MKAIAAWTNKNREKFWFAAAVNALLLLFLLVVFRPAYETNDDVGLCNLINGAKGYYDGHLVYSNYVLGTFVAACYRLIQRIPWYPLLQYAVLFAAFTAIFFVLQKRISHPAAFSLAMLVLSFFAYEGYIRLQYTKTAGIVTAAGFFLLLFALERERLSWKAALGGILLVCAGFMYRSEQFLAETALMSGIAAALLLEMAGPDRVRRRRLFWRCAAALGVLFALLAALYAADKAAYDSADWQEYFAYNEARTELFDYGFPSYSENEEAYQELGVDEVTYRMARNWNLDAEVFSTELMQEIAKLKEPRHFDRALLKSFFEEFPVSFATIPSFYICVLIFACGLAWGRFTKTSVLVLLYEAAAVMALYLYLFYRGRYLYSRVDVGIWLAVSLVILWQFAKGETEQAYFSGREGLALVLTVLCIFQLTWQKNWRVNTEREPEKMRKEKTVIEEINEDTEHLYLIKAGSVAFSKAYRTFEYVPEGIGGNMYNLGGWQNQMPSSKSVLAEYGITNPFRDMIGNDKVYLVDKNIDMTIEYLRTWYDETAEAEAVGTVGELTVYQIKHGGGT